MAKAKKPTPKELYWARKHKEEQEKAALLPPGLVNHGNTCFMNTVLQGLVATNLLEEIVHFHGSNEHPVHPLASPRSPLMINGRGPEDVQQEWVQGMPTGDVFIHTLERAWHMREKRDRSSMSPRELLNRLGHKYDQYLDFRQQDAHEFFLHLLDGMRMEELDIIKRRQPQPAVKPSKRRARDAAIPRHTFPDAIPEEDRLVPFVDMLWGGKFLSVLICATCKNVSHTYEDFDDLSLSITHDESKERKRDRLRAFASKFISQSSRLRDPSHPRPQSVSQPPSPALPTTALEPLEEGLEPPRRRSFESNSIQAPTPEPVAERRKVEILERFKAGVSDDGPADPTTNQPGQRSRKASDAGLGRLGRRISVGMSLGAKKEKKPGKAEREHKQIKVKNGKNGENDEEGNPGSPASSKPASRQPSPGPTQRLNGPTRLPRPSEHDMREAAYLRRLLEDTTPSPSNHLALLRMASQNGSSSSANASSVWSKISSVQGVEDCLRMFTAVEALDGDNMFGCRNCWKIANGQVPKKTTSQSEDDNDSSSDEKELQDQKVRPQALDPIHSFSTPNLTPSVIEDHRTSRLSSSAMSSPFPTPSEPEGTTLNQSALDLNLGGSNSTSMTSFATTPHPDIPGLRSRQLYSVSQEGDLSPNSRVGSREPSIPIIATVSPPPGGVAASASVVSQANRTPNVRFPNYVNGSADRSRDSLRLPDVRSRHTRDGESSISSEDSERDETSGVSDGDGSLASASVLQSVGAQRPRRSSLPRSKQVIYRRALKRYLIARPPPVLVIHFKRFQQVSKSPVTLFGNLKKLDDYVSFPEYLDIRPFLAPKKVDYGLGKGELMGRVAEKGKREEDLPCVYRLYAVVVHIGNMLGGHYIAYTALPPPKERAPSSNHDPAKRLPPSAGPEKGNSSDPKAKEARQWCYISDTVVRLVSLDEVLKAKAYLCMYERTQ